MKSVKIFVVLVPFAVANQLRQEANTEDNSRGLMFGGPFGGPPGPPGPPRAVCRYPEYGCRNIHTCEVVGPAWCVDSAGDQFDACVRTNTWVSDCEVDTLNTPGSPGFEHRTTPPDQNVPTNDCRILIQPGGTCPPGYSYVSEDGGSGAIAGFNEVSPGDEYECYSCPFDGPDPECEGAYCDNWVPCSEDECTQPVCVTLSDDGSTSNGDGFCVEGTTLCSTLDRCWDGICPSGLSCAIDTCCEDPVCMGEEHSCDNTDRRDIRYLRFQRFMEGVATISMRAS